MMSADDIAAATGYSPRYINQALRQGRLTRPLLRRMRAAGVPVLEWLHDVEAVNPDLPERMGEAVSLPCASPTP